MGKIGNYFVNSAFTLVAKYYNALKNTEEDKEQRIGHLRCSIKTRRRMPRVPSILLVGINLIVTLSQEKSPLMEKDLVQLEPYIIIEVA